jgi:hypothetical protein
MEQCKVNGKRISIELPEELTELLSKYIPFMTQIPQSTIDYYWNLIKKSIKEVKKDYDYNRPQIRAYYLPDEMFEKLMIEEVSNLDEIEYGKVDSASTHEMSCARVFITMNGEILIVFKKTQMSFPQLMIHELLHIVEMFLNLRPGTITNAWDIIHSIDIGVFKIEDLIEEDKLKWSKWQWWQQFDIARAILKNLTSGQQKPKQ